MPVKHITEKFIKSIRTEKNQEDYWDQAVKNRGLAFGVRVYKSGSREFICRYRFAGKRRLYSLGDANNILLSEGRLRASKIKSELERGVDPASLKEQRREAPTIKDLCDLYLKQYAYQKKDGGLGDADMLNRDVVPSWGALKVGDVKRRAIIELLEHITHDRCAPVAANRTRSVLSRMFKFAVERDMIEISPCSGLPAKNKETSKVRVLSDSEIKTFWSILETDSSIYGKIAKLMLLTAQRPSEICGMQWSEIEDKNWTLPASRTKTAQSHLVPLAPMAFQIIDSQMTALNNTDFVFPTNRSDFVKSRTIQRYISDICDAHDIAIFTPHDLRRTARTNFSKLRIEPDVRERILNHAQGKIQRTYDIHDYYLEKRHALQLWEKRLLAIVDQKNTQKLVSISA